MTTGQPTHDDEIDGRANETHDLAKPHSEALNAVASCSCGKDAHRCRTTASSQMQSSSGGDVFSEQDLREMALRLAHGIRNPLATIKSAVQLIRRLGLDREKADPYFDSVINEVARIDRAMRDVERFVRLGNPRPRRVLVGEVVSAAVASLSERAAERGVQIAYSGCPEAAVDVDPEHLRMALGELVENAISASPPDASIVIDCEPADDGHVLIHVDDSGHGVADTHAPQILRPFYSTGTRGSGLGLNVVQRTCRYAAGKLLWCNKPDGGCRFTLSLPEA